MKACGKIIVLGDLHAPFHDKRAYALAKAVIKAYKPDVLVSIGDFVDSYAVSDYPKHPSRKNRLKYEVEAAAKLVKELRPLAGSFFLTAGNHEYRLEKYLATRAPELYGLVCMRELLDICPHEWLDYGEVLKIGKTHFTHDVGFCGAGAALKSLAAFGGNLVFGHSHRPEIVYSKNLREESHFCMNVGWLGDPSMIDYTHRVKTRAWKHGVGLVEQDSSGNSWASFVPFVAGKAMLQGKMIHV